MSIKSCATKALECMKYIYILLLNCVVSWKIFETSL